MTHRDFECVAKLSDQIQRELQIYRALDGYRKSSGSGMGVQMPKGDPTLDAASERAALREQIKEHRQALNDARARCQEKIQLLSAPEDRQILQLRFLYRHTCERCADIMGISLRHVHRLKNRAIARYSALEEHAHEAIMGEAQSRAADACGSC